MNAMKSQIQLINLYTFAIALMAGFFNVHYYVVSLNFHKVTN